MTIIADEKLSSIDPVCGLEITPTETNPVEVMQGHTYYFCTEKCRRAFMIEPLKYIYMLSIFDLDKEWWQRYLSRREENDPHG